MGVVTRVRRVRDRFTIALVMLDGDEEGAFVVEDLIVEDRA